MTRLPLLALLAWICAGEAAAHAGDAPIAPSQLWHHWSFDPLVWAPLLIAHWAYGRGVLRAWRRAGSGRVIPYWRVGCFLGGEALLVLALISPLDPLGETLLSAHMIQHITLTTLAPPLLVLGAPATAWLWALPRGWRERSFLRALGALGDALSRPLSATALHAVALWAWHAPAAFEAALASDALHTLEHMSFFATALMFWQAVLRRHVAPTLAAICILATFVQSGVLGGVLSLAPAPLYPAYGDYATLWGITALVDQQLAGLAMWAPAGAAYFFAFLAVLARLLSSPPPSAGIMRASTSSLSMK